MIPVKFTSTFLLLIASIALLINTINAAPLPKTDESSDKSQSDTSSYSASDFESSASLAAISSALLAFVDTINTISENTDGILQNLTGLAIPDVQPISLYHGEDSDSDQRRLFKRAIPGIGAQTSTFLTMPNTANAEISSLRNTNNPFRPGSPYFQAAEVAPAAPLASAGKPNSAAAKPSLSGANSATNSDSLAANAPFSASKPSASENLRASSASEKLPTSGEPATPFAKASEAEANPLAAFTGPKTPANANSNNEMTQRQQNTQNVKNILNENIDRVNAAEKNMPASAGQGRWSNVQSDSITGRANGNIQNGKGVTGSANDGELQGLLSSEKELKAYTSAGSISSRAKSYVETGVNEVVSLRASISRGDHGKVAQVALKKAESFLEAFITRKIVAGIIVGSTAGAVASGVIAHKNSTNTTESYQNSTTHSYKNSTKDSYKNSRNTTAGADYLALSATAPAASIDATDVSERSKDDENFGDSSESNNLSDNDMEDDENFGDTSESNNLSDSDIENDENLSDSSDSNNLSDNDMEDDADRYLNVNDKDASSVAFAVADSEEEEEDSSSVFYKIVEVSQSQMSKLVQSTIISKFVGNGASNDGSISFDQTTSVLPNFTPAIAKVLQNQNKFCSSQKSAYEMFLKQIESAEALGSIIDSTMSSYAKIVARNLGDSTDSFVADVYSKGKRKIQSMLNGIVSAQAQTVKVSMAMGIVDLMSTMICSTSTNDDSGDAIADELDSTASGIESSEN